MRRQIPGDLRLGEPRKMHGDAIWVALLSNGKPNGKGYARGSVGNARAALFMCIDDAVANGLIPHNTTPTSSPTSRSASLTRWTGCSAAAGRS